MRKASKITKDGHRMTLKYRKWLKYYLETGNATKAAELAYGRKYATNANIGYQNVKKIDYQELLEAKGITDTMLLDRLHEGLYAKKIHSSHTEPDREIEDKAVQHKYLETALKLKKRLGEDTTTVIVDKHLLMDAVPTTVIEGETVLETSTYDK